MSDQDLLNLPFDDQQWQKLSKIVQIKEIDSKNNIDNSIKLVTKAMGLASAIMYTGSQQKGYISRKLAIMSSSFIYAFSRNKADRQSQLFFSDPDIETLSKIFNIQEQNRLIDNSMNLVYQSVKYNQIIYIKRQELVEPITLGKLEAAIQNQEENKIHPMKNQSEYKYIPDMKQYKNQLFTYDKEKIQIRVLCKANLNKSLKTQINQIVIHIHGGGFVGMSSGSHQVYTRQWANSLQAVLFSIDYRLSPEYAYPAAVDDVWQAYNWILRYSYKIFKVHAESVVLIGDSAGANLVCALTILAIQHGIRVPNGIVLAYPALILKLKRFTPSYINALDDLILPHTALKLCYYAYLNESKVDNHKFYEDKDPLISVFNANDEILKNFPVTRIICGDKDPFHDDCWRFSQKLQNLNKNIKMIIYKNMPHGFLNFDFAMPSSKQCIKDTCNYIEELLTNKNI